MPAGSRAHAGQHRTVGVCETRAFGRVRIDEASVAQVLESRRCLRRGAAAISSTPPRGSTTAPTVERARRRRSRPKARARLPNGRQSDVRVTTLYRHAGDLRNGSHSCRQTARSPGHRADHDPLHFSLALILLLAPLASCDKAPPPPPQSAVLDAAFTYDGRPYPAKVTLVADNPSGRPTRAERTGTRATLEVPGRATLTIDALLPPAGGDSVVFGHHPRVRGSIRRDAACAVHIADANDACPVRSRAPHERCQRQRDRQQRGARDAAGRASGARPYAPPRNAGRPRRLLLRP